MTLDRSGFDRPGPEPEVAAEVPEFSASLELVLLLLDEDDFRRGRFCGRSELDRSLDFNGLSGKKTKQPFENFRCLENHRGIFLRVSNLTPDP